MSVSHFEAKFGGLKHFPKDLTLLLLIVDSDTIFWSDQNQGGHVPCLADLYNRDAQTRSADPSLFFADLLDSENAMTSRNLYGLVLAANGRSLRIIVRWPSSSPHT